MRWKDFFVGQWHWWSTYVCGPLRVQLWSVRDTLLQVNFILGSLMYPCSLAVVIFICWLMASGFYKWGHVHIIPNMGLEPLVFSHSYRRKGLQHTDTYIQYMHLLTLYKFFRIQNVPRVIWLKTSRHILKRLWFTICRLSSEDFGLMGLRYGSRNLSAGVTLMPFSCN